MNKRTSDFNYDWAIRICILCLLFLAACTQDKTSSDIYYPVDSLLSAQIGALLHYGAEIKKVALMDKAEANTQFTPDSAQWLKELEIFRNLQSVNKPVNHGLYEVSESIDSESGLKLRTIASSDEEVLVEYLKLFYDGSLNNIRKIEGKYYESNSMYQGTRYLMMEFEGVDKQTILKSYTVRGGQKMFLGDSVQYTITASVTLPNK